MAPSNPDEFDGYRKWLGIANKKRPPTHYELLAISLDEDDPEVIRAAAEQRRHYVETKRGDGHDSVVTEILFAIGEAEATLLNDDMRRDYDRQLNLFEKRRKNRQVDPHAPLSRIRSRPGKTVGEDSGIVKTFIGIMAVIVVGFGGMAWFSFQLPWNTPLKKVDVEHEIPVPAAVPPDMADRADGAEKTGPKPVVGAATPGKPPLADSEPPAAGSVSLAASDNNPQMARKLKLDAENFVLRGRFNVLGDAIEFLKGDNANEQSVGISKDMFTPPLTVTYEVTAFPDACFDIFPGMLGKIRLMWGVEYNQKTRVRLGDERIEIKHIPIEPNNKNTIVMKVDKRRRLTITVNGVERYSRIVDENVDLSGPILIGGGIGHMTFSSVLVDQRGE
jgi:hypothetical protein